MTSLSKKISEYVSASDIKFLLVIAIILLADLLIMCIAWFNSADARGWWPLILWVDLIVAMVYAIVFTMIDRWSGGLTFKFTVAHVSLLAATNILHNLLFYYSHTDWVRAVLGYDQSSILNRIVFGDVTHFAIYVFFLFIVLVRGIVFRRSDLVP